MSRCVDLDNLVWPHCLTLDVRVWIAQMLAKTSAAPGERSAGIGASACPVGLQDSPRIINLFLPPLPLICHLLFFHHIYFLSSSSYSYVFHLFRPSSTCSSLHPPFSHLLLAEPLHNLFTTSSSSRFNITSPLLPPIKKKTHVTHQLSPFLSSLLSLRPLPHGVGGVSPVQ